MRKRTVNHVADTIFWYVIYFLPIMAYLIYLVALNGTAPMSIGAFFEDIVYSVFPGNPVSTALQSIFGESGVLPFFESGFTWILDFFAWFVGVYLCHLAVDFLLFIPRIAHKYMKKFTNSEE